SGSPAVLHLGVPGARRKGRDFDGAVRDAKDVIHETACEFRFWSFGDRLSNSLRDARDGQMRNWITCPRNSHLPASQTPAMAPVSLLASETATIGAAACSWPAAAMMARSSAAYAVKTVIATAS